MKKTLFYCFVVTFATLLVSGCNEELVLVDEQTPYTETIQLNISKPQFGSTSTRSAASWENGDCVYLLFECDGYTASGQAIYNKTDNKWQVNYYRALKRNQEARVKAFYFEPLPSTSSTDVALSAITGIYMDTLATYLYPTDGTLTVLGSLKPINNRIRFKGTAGTAFQVMGLTTYNQFSQSTGELTTTTSVAMDTIQTDGYSHYIYGFFTDSTRLLSVKNGNNTFAINCETTVLPDQIVGQSGWMDLPTERAYNGWRIPVTSIALSANWRLLEPNKTLQLQATCSPSNASNKDVLWTSSDEQVATVSNTGLVTLKGYKLVTITARSKDNSKVYATCEIQPTYVDLGLSVKWAARNVGATSPTECGDYFAWGETTTKSSFSWSTYKWCNGGAYSLTKYCSSTSYGTVDNKTDLDLSDDAARANWGEPWRMPTSSERDELIDQCTWTRTTQGGVSGYIVTGKNGNSIFLPVYGYKADQDIYSNSSGYYWTKDITSSFSYYASALVLSGSDAAISARYRYYGCSVRPVRP